MGTQGTLAQTNSVSQPKAFDWGITDERIRQTVERIVELCNPIQIIAFGSWARVEHRPDCDLDIAFILDDAPDAMERRPRYSHLQELLEQHSSCHRDRRSDSLRTQWKKMSCKGV